MRNGGKPAMARLLVAALAVCASVKTASATSRYDLIIRNGMVFDGSGAPGRVADVAINGDRIVRVGDLGSARGNIEEDATGLYVTPGFISLHDHTVPAAYAAADSLLTQGVTTAITNADGRGAIDIRKQLGSEKRFSLNYGAYIGFNAVWQSVVGLNDRRPSAAELETMRSIVASNFDAGAWGLSAGLDYKPAHFATTDEVISVAKAARDWRSNFPNHERLSEANGQSSLAGIAETISIGEAAGLMPVITHMKLQGKDRGKTGALFQTLKGAIDRGRHAGADAYPYTYGYTASLAQLLFPAWAQEGGRAALLTRLADPALRARIAAAIDAVIATRWNGISGVFFPQRREELAAAMRKLGSASAGEAVIQIYESGDEPVILRFGTEDDLVAILKNPLVAISCDCGSTTASPGHPRYWGAFPRFLGRYVREQRLVGWGEAVRKMTALPATMIGLYDRGHLLPGMVADITIFDPATIIDKATIDEPTQPSVGIRAVIVNGDFALRHGRVTEVRAGKPLFRTGRTPSRPMNFVVARSAKGSGSILDPMRPEHRLRIRFQVEQDANARRPKGSIRLIDPTGDLDLEMTAPSIIQTGKGWASITGIGRTAGRGEKAVTVIAEAVGTGRGGKPSVTVIVGGKTIAAGVVEDGGVQIRQGSRRAVP